jgi:hypothetical protein
MLPASVGFLYGLIFGPEDGGCMFFWNIRLSQTTQPKIPYIVFIVITVRASNPTERNFKIFF